MLPALEVRPGTVAEHAPNGKGSPSALCNVVYKLLSRLDGAGERSGDDDPLAKRNRPFSHRAEL